MQIPKAFAVPEIYPAKPDPAASKPALEPVRSKRRARLDCSCRHCRKARRTERMEPLTTSDRIWIGAVSIAWVVVVGLGIYVAVST